MKLGLLIVISVPALIVTITKLIKDKLHYHFQYENAIYSIIIVVLTGLTVFIMQKNPSISNKKINGIISACVFVFISLIPVFL